MALVQVQAKAKGILMTPRKVGEVASLVRGRSVADALVILEHTPRRAAGPVTKALLSAKANAGHNHNVNVETLQIEALHVSPGPRMKRFRPIARGSANPYQKKSTHLTVVVVGEEKVKPKAKVTTKTSGKSASTKAKTKGDK